MAGYASVSVLNCGEMQQLLDSLPMIDLLYNYSNLRVMDPGDANRLGALPEISESRSLRTQ